ncbi:GGDEF domain-containing protein [Acetanaerobacterium elongatum]|uniref:Diguanylate cyclase (GGDEF) domain-containing protein n=1 Tax=Acetanaerobacterium elongatum TaxID=258515 RepID=A0A1G9UFH4_9FIRM|nr:GGDEF domain-containing protein [Acetanaerobacterium elongatum]SDM58717.1 diguanylate cyclase (GGDEF) domain-containing protein [Acetanaerobacterium elongatum]
MKLINEKLLPPLTDEQEQGFAAELAKKCLLVARILLPVVLLLTLIDLIDLFFINPDAESLTGRVRAVYYVFLAVVSASFCIYLLHVYKNVFVKAKRVLLYTYLYSCFVCVWSTVIILYIPRGDAKSVALYFAIVICVAALAYMHPIRGIVLFLVNHLVFIGMFVTAYSGKVKLSDSIFNTTVVAALAIVISTSRYVGARRAFCSHAVIVQKNREIEEMNHKLSELVHTDVLTGLHNRRFLDEYMPALWQNAIAAQTPVSILMLDIDDFKCLNDYYGHHAGDSCIAKVARLMRECSDDGRDYVLRYGGEEFAVVMPGAKPSQAAETAERIRAAVEALNISNPLSALEMITVSIGLYGAVPTEEDTPKRFFRNADKALYQAKRNGKNRVEVFKPV